MAKIESLISRIRDESLRDAIAAEVKEMKKTKRFGLVFEEHLPETVRLPNVVIRKGSLVAKKAEPGNACWVVRSIKKDVAECVPPGASQGVLPFTQEIVSIPLKELVTVKPFGEPIFPTLTPIDRVSRGGKGKPWHTLINADNFHALQLLRYCYEGQVDVIYIDPPYNTGARDWKYNNDYVDKTDGFKHSKWLSMLKKRLDIAKRLLRFNGVLVVTIDDREHHHLRCLLAELFPSFSIQTANVVINPKGVTQGRLSRVDEQIVFCFPEGSSITGRSDDYLSPEPDDGFDGSIGKKPRWKGLLRSGTNARREDRRNMFFPVLIDEERCAVVGTGEPLPFEQEPVLGMVGNGLTEVWPIRTSGDWGNWGVGHITLRKLIKNGFVGVGAHDSKRNTWALSYLSQGLREQLEAGVLEIVSFDKTKNLVDVRYADLGERQIKTVWKRSRHDAGVYGSNFIKKVLGRTESFAFPKSIYSVEDAIIPMVLSNKDAIILDFFAGSGTTYNAIALLNARDGGQRRSILVTNNEVENATARRLQKIGIFMGDPKFEQEGICESVTWPRCKNVTIGKSSKGQPLEGSYLGADSEGNELLLSDGFKENIEYFRLDFLNPSDVERGDAFEGILPILWMMAGCISKREDRRGSTPYYIAKHSPFAVLIRESHFSDFAEKLAERPDITHVFLVTDSEENFALMRRELGNSIKCYQLYKSYLENFRLNSADSSLMG